MLKPWLLVGAAETLVAALAQSQMLPDNLINILAQVPLVAVIIWLQLQNQKWLEHMLEVQRSSIVSIYEGQQKFMNALLTQLETKQNSMIDRIELLTQQVALTGATVAETTKLDEMLNTLMDRIEGVKG